MIKWKVVSLLVLTLTGATVRAEVAETGQTGIQSTQAQAMSMVSKADEALLKERALARWQALIEGNFNAAYQFETPAYRAVYTLDQFRYRFGNQTLWRMANVMDIHYDDPIVARVQVEVTYRYVEAAKDRGMQTMTHRVNETWLHKEGQWWYQQD